MILNHGQWHWSYTTGTCLGFRGPFGGQKGLLRANLEAPDQDIAAICGWFYPLFWPKMVWMTKNVVQNTECKHTGLVRAFEGHFVATWSHFGGPRARNLGHFLADFTPLSKPKQPIYPLNCYKMSLKGPKRFCMFKFSTLYNIYGHSGHFWPEKKIKSATNGCNILIWVLQIGP